MPDWVEGKSLGQALLLYAPPELRARHKALTEAQAGEGFPYLDPEFADPDEGPDEITQRKHADRGTHEIDRLERELARRVLRMLRLGELRAAGRTTPLTLTPIYEEIPPETWYLLRADFRGSSATGDGLKVVGIRVYHRDEIAAETALRPETQPAAGVPQLVGAPAKLPVGDEALNRHAAALEAAERRAAAADSGNPQCPVCGKHFEPRDLRQKNCSQRCTKRASKERREKERQAAERTKATQSDA